MALLSSGLRITAVTALALAAATDARPQVEPVSLSTLTQFTFPSGLVAARSGQRFAWTLMQRGERSLWVADGPAFAPHRLVQYPDDGQELTNLVFSHDGAYLIYVRGGNHAANGPAPGNLMPNPTSSPRQPSMQVWSVPVAGGAPILLGDGDEPAASPADLRVAFRRGREIWWAPADGSKPAARLFFARGSSESPAWSPDGRMLAFASNRGDYGYIAIYSGDDQPIRYIAPTTWQDSVPRWSPDGSRIAFVRRRSAGGSWSIWIGDAASGDARQLWQSPSGPRGAYPRTLGGSNLQWAADRVVFLADTDGWPHLYSVPPAGGEPQLLTPGKFMVEFVRMTADGRFAVYNANTGADPDDSERRHLFRVAVTGGGPVALTSGKTIDWDPATSADGKALAYVTSDATRPPLVRVIQLETQAAQTIHDDLLPRDFPSRQLVVPEHVVVRAPDGVEVHGQLFSAPGTAGRRPAVLFVHGGPARQMLLGWDYLGYYDHAYAVHQAMASKGYVVLSVNYRLGIGYGHDFHHPPRTGGSGASEYQDVLAAARYLQGRPDVDPARIGIWGGSYGGYLTALALARNSDVFAAGVDLHGRHDFTVFTIPSERQAMAAAIGDGVTRTELDERMRVAWESSPVSAVKTWRSPVLFIHGDDDRNVPVEQTVDLVQRLRRFGVAYEEMIIPDDVHSFLLFRNWQKVDRAIVDFFDRKLTRTTSENRQ